MLKRFSALVIWTEICLLAPTAATAQPLREALRPLAQEIRQVVIDDQRQTAIQIVEVVGPENTNAGPGIAEELRLALNTIQPGIVREQASLKLKGEYDLIIDPKTAELVVLQVAVSIRDPNGRKFFDRSIELRRTTGLFAALTGQTVSLAKHWNDPVARHLELQTARKAPGFHVDDHTIIRTKANNPYGVEVLVLPNNQAPRDAAGWERIAARTLTNENGQATLTINRDEVFALRVHNRSEFDAAVVTTIDGLDVFAFSEVRDERGLPRFKYCIVAPGHSTIVGWQVNNTRTASFRLNEYGKRPGSKVGVPAKAALGIISLRFAVVWKHGTPAGESYYTEPETIFETVGEIGFKEVKRKIGQDRDVISIRFRR